jgi:hypothetical protein
MACAALPMAGHPWPALLDLLEDPKLCRFATAFLGSGVPKDKKQRNCGIAACVGNIVGDIVQPCCTIVSNRHGLKLVLTPFCKCHIKTTISITTPPIIAIYIIEADIHNSFPLCLKPPYRQVESIPLALELTRVCIR